MTTEYAKPTTSIVSDCRAMMTYYANIHLRPLTLHSLKTDLTCLWKYFVDLDQNTSDILRKASNYLDVSYVKDALDDATSQTGAVNADYYKARLRAVLDEVTFEVSSWSQELESSLINFSGFSYTGNRYRLKQLRETLSNLRKIEAQAENSSSYATLLSRSKKLNSAIEAYDSQTLYSQLKPILNEVEKTAKSAAEADTPAHFKKELIVGGVQTAMSVLGKALDTISYEQLREARDQIDAQIGMIEKTFDENKCSTLECCTEIGLIEDFEQLQKPRQEFISEVQKIASTQTILLQGLLSLPSDEAKARHFIDHASKIKTYADDVLRSWSISQ